MTNTDFRTASHAALKALDDADHPLLGLVELSIGDFRFNSERILNLGRKITETTQQVAKAIESGYTLNELGELGTMAVDYDRACTLRTVATKQLLRIVGILRRDGRDDLADLVDAVALFAGIEFR